ncbi:hypothetical protein EVAR_66908_1 [Eumeta japonica]|uniref:Uncharacterized protein n=1 Tax=Eumeta variegata TaxID=151549 RepID=A0A4C1Z644_EUMVA|nr:hypothetical protein EVAR_66908_1 [Eumeta japonica]
MLCERIACSGERGIKAATYLPIFTNQKTPEKFDVGFRCQPRGCRQPHRTLLIDIEMPLAHDSPTGSTLGSPRHRESREISTRVGTSG